MVKDLRYILKRVIIGVLIAVILFSIKSCDVHAATLQHVKYFDASYNLLYQGAANEVNTSRSNVRYVRYTFNNVSLPAAHNFSASLVFNSTCTSDYCWTYWNTSNSGINTAGGYRLQSPTDAGTLLQRQMGANSFYKESSYTFKFNTSGLSTTQTSYFIQFDLGSARQVTYTNLNGFTFSDLGAISSQGQGATSGDIGSIISNANSNTNQIIANQNTNTTNIINNNNENTNKINDTLTDDSTDDPTSDINSMKSYLPTSGPVTQLITLPITLYQAILNSLNGSCSSINLGSLYNHNLTLPCINLQSLLGSTLWSIIDLLCCGLFILAFRKRMVDIFNHMTSLNDRGNEVE